MPMKRSLFSMVAFNGSIYSIGGMVDGKIVTNFEQYHIDSNNWTTETPMIIARASATAAVLNNNIYVVGGATKINSAQMTTSSETATVERFDGKSWTMVIMINIKKKKSVVKLMICIFQNFRL